MIENVLERKHASLSVKITVKTLVAALVVALAVTLPQIAHIAFGQKAGVTLLPMYLPVLLGGCLMGAGWGIGIGLASPLVSFIITSAAGSAMPAAARLPFMMAELAVFAAVRSFREQDKEECMVHLPRRHPCRGVRQSVLYAFRACSPQCDLAFRRHDMESDKDRLDRTCAECGYRAAVGSRT